MKTMTLIARIKKAAQDAISKLYPDQTSAIHLTVNQTKEEFAGDYSIVLFPLVKLLRQNPANLGAHLGDFLLKETDIFSSYEVVSGFLNLAIRDSYWLSFLKNHFNDIRYGECPGKDIRVMVEYSSPNTNKPLHFGHLRNIFLGAAVAEVLKANGNQVIKANLINDRGIHICKSMIAWQRYAGGATPEQTGIKGDHLVGDFYVRFNEAYKEEVENLKSEGLSQEEAEKQAPILREAQAMLQRWEAGDEEIMTLWKTMNGWVYEGFKDSYKRLGVTFDQMYYESETYLLGKSIVEKGLEKGVLYRKEDGSVWIDLTDKGLDEKLLLRADGTSVYITQDLGTAQLKYQDYQLDKNIYVIGDEQNYHMQVLKAVLEKLDEPCAAGIQHLSYGMVELPTGRMKSREGTVVDADDMMDEMIALAKEQTEKAGKTEGFSAQDLQHLYETIGLGALKFYLLRVDPKKKMIFDPQESIDLHGFTATFIQYAHARICSILRKEECPLSPDSSRFQSLMTSQPFTVSERKLALMLEQYPAVLDASAEELNPGILCNYAFHLARQFNSFYDVHSVSQAESEEKKELRLMLIILTASILRHSMGLCGIRMPEKM